MIINYCNNSSFYYTPPTITCRLVIKQGFLYEKLVINLNCIKYPEIFKISIRKHVKIGIYLPTIAISILSSKSKAI